VRRASSAILALWGVLAGGAASAHAGGMYLPTRGVRPTARGGAFTAGADDLGALWFNPAGLAHLGGASRRQFMLDVGYVTQSVTYERIDSGFNEHPEVTSAAAGAPIPTLGVGFDVSEDVTVGGGVLAPYAALGSYPSAGAQRYSMVNMAKSALVIAEVAVAWRASERVRIGVGVQNLFVHLVSSIVLSGCPGETLCAPEDPEFDSLSQIEQNDLFNPSGVIGAQVDLGPRVRLGLAGQLPFRVSGEGKLSVVLPSSGFFADAEVVGDRAAMSYTLPAMIRGGVEVEPIDRWRFELDVDLELWSMHDEFVIEPRDVRIVGTPGVGTYEVGTMVIPRHFEDTLAVKLGLEGQVSAGFPLTIALGYAYETAAAPDAFLSVMTVDGAKHLVGGGLGYPLGGTRVFAAAAYVAVSPRSVSPSEGLAPQLTPIRDEPQEEPLATYVNWGDYSSSWFMAGVGVTADF
jgi:long-chain fatty acid transport protein